MKYRIKEWATYQHYRDRNPPWIKLHFELLTSRTWVSLDDASRVLAVASMLLASRTDGVIDASEGGLAYLQRVAYLNSPPDLKPLIDSGFLVPLADASTMLADARPETETETEVEKETEGEREGEPRAREAQPGRVVVNPATASGLDLIAPTEAQLVMLADRAAAAGVNLETWCNDHGVPLAGINVTKIKLALDDLIATSRRPPPTFAEQKLANTDAAIAEVMKRVANANN
jgi:hypothetical protein